MSLAWKLKRLSAMDGREIAYRLRQATQARLERLGFGLASPVTANACSGKSWAANIPREFDAAPYRAAADRVLEGRYDIFALQGAQLGFPPRWNKDPKTGLEAPLDFGKLLDYRDEHLVGDIKYLWEPNRHLELVTLAQAWHLTGETRYAHGCRSMLDSWFEQCPYPMGPNWTSSLEHAVRLVNWSFAWHLLGAEGSILFAAQAGQAFKARWLNSIQQHCHFISGYLSRYSSANNHLLGELTGLYVGATTWPLWQLSQRWRDQAQRELLREALQQNGPDGVNREQAFWYHHSVAQMLLLAGLIGQANGQEFGREYWQRIESMLEFVASIMDVAGHVPSIGDSDDGVMVRLAPVPEFHPFRSLLATGAVLFDRADFKRKAQSFDDESRWLLGDLAAQVFAKLTPDSNGSGTIRRAFDEGGYYLLGDRFDTAEEIRILADAGPLGYLSIAAHGHADALSFTLSAGGRELLIDPGTFSYHTQRGWRDYFRGTAAHNTVRIDGEDQSVSGGTFLWIRHGNATAQLFETTADHDRLLASHDGYARLPDPVAVEREWLYERNSRALSVTDVVRCRAPHHVQQFWHCADDCEVTLGGEDLLVRAGGVVMKMSWPTGFSARLLCGSEQPPAGWKSPGYDRKLPCSTIIVSGEISGDWRGTSRFSLSFDDGRGTA